MKVGIKATSMSCRDRAIEKYPCLKDFNLVEIPCENIYATKIKSYIEINSIDDIIKLINAADQDIVFYRKPEWDNTCEADYIIEIYDDWRE